MSARWTRPAIGAAVAVLAAVAVASAATVGTKSKTETLPADGTTHRATVDCPAGTKPSGGGMRLSEDVDDYAQGNYPAGKRGWRGAAYRNPLQPDAEFTVFARCLKGGNLSGVSKRANVPDDQTPKGATAKCPDGTALVGGGVRINSDVDLEVNESHPAGKRGWRGAARPSSTAGKVFAYARCLKGAKVTRKSKTIEMPGDSATHEVTARCPKGTKMTGGGAKLADPQAYMQGSYPQGKRAWTAAGYDTGKLTAIALCLKR